MSLMQRITANEQAEVDAPQTGALKFYRVLFVLFLFSFVFDYRALDIGFGAERTGGSAFQYIFLGIALLSGCAASVVGVRHLFIRPGVFIVMLWWGYVIFSFVVAFYWGNDPSRIMRLAIPRLLVGLGLNLTLIAAANGMRPGEAVKWFLFACLTNVGWRFLYGVTASDAPLSEIRMEILSPAMRFLFAWAGCAFLLRHKFTWWSLVIFGVPLAVAAISVTRSMILPIGVSFIVASFCLLLAMLWKMYDRSFPLKKLGPILVMGAVFVFVVMGTMMAVPNLADRWYQRVFDNRGESGALSEDLSTLMRKAEAKSMWDILEKDPHSFIFGRGIGASYYWDESYYPELFLVYPDDRHQFPHEIYTAGHSIWTYTLFSSGFIGVGVVLLAFFIPMWMSLRSAFLTSRTVMGPRAWDSFLVFLPFVAMWAILSESITRNPFDERFTGVLFGFMMALPQFFYNRAWYLGYREDQGQNATQLILNEDDIEGIEEELFEDLPSQGGTGGHHLVGSKFEYQSQSEKEVS